MRPAGRLRCASDFLLDECGCLTRPDVHLHAQRGERPGRIATDCSRLAADQVRDLDVAESLVIAERQYGALPRGQLAQLGEQSVTFGVAEGVIGSTAMIYVRGGARGNQPPFAATPAQELIEDHLADVVLR